jgi:hypothetical protein
MTLFPINQANSLAVLADALQAGHLLYVRTQSHGGHFNLEVDLDPMG